MGLPQIILRAHRSKLAVHGEAIVYRSQTAGDVEVTALHKQTAARMQETDGTFVVTVADDWHIAAADLVDADGAKIKPADGDRVLHVDADGIVTAYDVLPWADEPARQYADVSRQIHAVHTKQAYQFVAGQLLAEDGSPLTTEAGASLISEAVIV